MTRHHPWILAGLFSLACSALASAEERPFVTASLGITIMSEGPGRNVGQVLDSMGFESAVGTHPRPTGKNGGHLAFEAHVRIGERHAIGVMASGARGAVTGRVRGSHPSEYLEVGASYTVDTVALLYSVWASEILRVGLGPASHDTRLQFRSSAGPSVSLEHRRTLGWVAEAALNVPLPDRPFHAFELTLQRRDVGSQQVQPPPLRLDHGPWKSTGTFSWPAMRVNGSHWLLGISLAVRF